MAWMTGHGNSVGPGIMSVARVCGTPQRILGSIVTLLPMLGLRARGALGHRSVWLGMSRGQSLMLAADEVEVATVDEQPGPLAENEDRVQSIDGVGEEGEPAADREEPERERNHALAFPLGGDPLHEEAHGETRLPQEAHQEPQVLRTHHG